MKNFKKILCVILLFLIIFSAIGCRKSPPLLDENGVLSSYSNFGSIPPKTEAASSTAVSSTQESNNDSFISSIPSSSPAQPTLSQNTTQSQDTQEPYVPTAEKSEEIRAVWISYLEMKNILLNKSKKEFKKSIEEYMDNIVASGLNTVIFQVRSHGDAFYKSSIFPTSYHFTTTRQDTAPFDPFKIAVEEAKKRCLRIEAWVNPYRGPEYEPNNARLSENDIIKRWYDEQKVFTHQAHGSIYYFFNPADPNARQLILNGISEIIDNYDIDGIHFDDYFYPTPVGEIPTNDWIDDPYYEIYALQNESKADFRRRMVSELVKSVYNLAHSKGITFGISPAGNIDNCLNKNYADVVLWSGGNGYVDYIAPQIYWSYGQGTLPFEVALENWKSLVKSDTVKLIVGLAAHKVQNPTYSNFEFWFGGNILSRQITDARLFEKYSGFIIFRYEYYFSGVCDTERQNVSSILK